MTTRATTLTARTPFPTLRADSLGPDASISYRDHLGLATVHVRRGLTAVLARRLRDHFALEIPNGARRSEAGPLGWAGIGPSTWLASCEDGHKTFATSLAAVIGDVTAVSDQSDGYSVLRVTGTRVPTILSKLVPLDLDPGAFAPNHVAATVTAHTGVLLWRLDTPSTSPATFEIAIPRSLAGSFWDALVASAIAA